MRASHAQSSLCSKPYLPCSHSVQKASPRGEAGALATDEGDKSALMKGIHSSHAPCPPITREAALFAAAHRPIRPKTSLHGSRRPKTPGISSNQFGGCRAGKFFGVSGGARRQKVRLRARLVSGVRRACILFVSADLSPLISRLRASFPPRGSLLYAVRTWQI